MAVRTSAGQRGRGRVRVRREGSEAEFSRVLAFSDGVFAIAITLLVLQLEVPADVGKLSSDLASEWPDLFAFGLSFAVLGRVWWVFHHRLFSGLAEFDSTLIALNFAYLAMVTLVPFTSELLGDFGDEPTAVIAYAANLGLLNLIGGVMIEYAFAQGLMRPEMSERRDEFTGRANWVIPAIFLASIPLALVSPLLATLVWLTTLGIAPRVVRRWTSDRDRES